MWCKAALKCALYNESVAENAYSCDYLAIIDFHTGVRGDEDSTRNLLLKRALFEFSQSRRRNMYTMEVFVGVDIGGSHVSVGYIDSTGQLLGATADVEIDRLTLKPEQMITIIRSLVDKSKDKDWVICSIGIGCPGWAKNGVLVRASNLPHFQNFDFASALNHHYPNVPVLLLNDADAAVSAEVWGKDSKERYKTFTNVAMVTLGTGVGCGLILNGQLHLGSNGLIEAGHMIVCTAPDSRKCGCGQNGCVEAYASAYTTAKRLREADVAAGLPVAEDGVDGSKEVLVRYGKGDPAAVKVLEEVCSIVRKCPDSSCWFEVSPTLCVCPTDRRAAGRDVREPLPRCRSRRNRVHGRACEGWRRAAAVDPRSHGPARLDHPAQRRAAGHREEHRVRRRGGRGAGGEDAVGQAAGAAAGGGGGAGAEHRSR
jgi:glucokinase